MFTVRILLPSPALAHKSVAIAHACTRTQYEKVTNLQLKRVHGRDSACMLVANAKVECAPLAERDEVSGARKVDVWCDPVD